MTSAKPERRILVAAMLAAFATMSPAAFSQQTATPAKPAGEDEAKTLSTITVTAQKREEQLQDVPISVTVLSKKLLQDTGVRDVKDLQILVPVKGVPFDRDKQRVQRDLARVGADRLHHHLGRPTGKLPAGGADHIF